MKDGNLVLISLLAYSLGSIPFGKIAGNFYGLDIRKKGSGNIGFANVWRVLGWRPACLVLAGDVLKGFIPTLVASRSLPVHQIMAVGLIAMLGHIFPVWLKFKGGKGISTGLGVTLAINFPIGLAGLAVYILSFAGFRKSAPSSLLAAAALPILFLIFMRTYFWFYVLLLAISLITHRNNIKQMLGKT